MAWLGTWAYRTKLTISAEFFDTDLTHFPVPIFIQPSTGVGNLFIEETEPLGSAIFTEIGANSKKIAITKSDGTTQLYVEVAYWNTANGAILYTSKSDFLISGSTNTEIYIYYDNTQSENTSFVGNIGEAAAKNVWDSNFKLVTHLCQEDPSISFKNSVNGASGSSSNLNASHVISSTNIKKTSFMSSSTQRVQFPAFNISTWGSITIEAIAARLAKGYTDGFIGIMSQGMTAGFDHDRNYELLFEPSPSTSQQGMQIVFTESNAYIAGAEYLYASLVEPNNTIIFGNRYHFCGTWDGSINAGATKMFISGELKGNGYASKAITNATETDPLYVGGSRFSYGKEMEEVRISSCERTEAWIVATSFSYNCVKAIEGTTTFTAYLGTTKIGKMYLGSIPIKNFYLG